MSDVSHERLDPHANSPRFRESSRLRIREIGGVRDHSPVCRSFGWLLVTDVARSFRGSSGPGCELLGSHLQILGRSTLRQALISPCN
jgi:hypothetical protein